MAGQSNMVGHGSLAKIPLFPLDYRCKIYGYDEQWRNAAEPMSDHQNIVHSVFYDDDDKASCGVAFADQMARLRPGVEIGLIPCAKGGIGLAAWQKSSGTNTLYGAMIARTRAALEHENSVLKGIVFYQGEEDAKTYSDATQWADRYEQFISDVRDEFCIADLPAIHTRLGPNGQSREYWQDVQSQQENVNLSNSDWVDASDLTTVDGVHLDTGSLIILAGRYAIKMAGILTW